MKNFKKAVSLFVALALTVPMTACGGSKTQPNAVAPEGATGNTKPVPIRWLSTGDAAAKAIAADDRIIKVINDKFGIQLNVEFVPEGNVEKVNVAMASGDFPDIVTGAYGTSATQQWMDNAMVIPLNDYTASNPNIKKWLDEYAWSAQDGKFFGIPFITQYNAANTLIVMRQDWLDALSLPYPKTLDDMKKVLTAFTNDDPDGNGKKDTYGFTAEKFMPNASANAFDWVFYANGMKYGDYALNADDKIIPWFEDPSFIPSMHYIKDLWDSGVVDPELMLNDASKKEEKFFQGKVGAMQGPMFRHVARYEKSLKELFPSASLAYDVPPAGKDGAFGLNKQGKNGTMTCITTVCKNPDKAAALIDFMISEEGNDLLRLGIEGIHYTKDVDRIVFNEEERQKDAFSPDSWAHALAWGAFYWPLDSNYIPDSDPDKIRALKSVVLATDAQVPNLVKQKTPLEIKNGSAVNDIYIQYFSDMLQGKIGIEDGTAKLSAAWRSQGGEEILVEVNDAYHASK